MNNKSKRIILRITEQEKEEIKKNAVNNGFTNLSEFIRLIAKYGRINIDLKLNYKELTNN